MASQEQRDEPDLKLQNTIVATTVSKVVQARTITGGIHHHRHPPPPPRPVPRQLCPAPHGFVGRADHGNTYEVASTLDWIGHPHLAVGQHEQARTVWREALRLYREQGRQDDAARVQRQLDDLDRA